ncbi:unnamed protein product [Lactuca saligna]|uniref:Helicase C-terminal domain-containing protein n=1 Tax=Lactuca saligna TaxID=75948 RepID=A0AA36DVK0_LACSI|nr:unnamed protein product [Lactuca saligna]
MQSAAESNPVDGQHHFHGLLISLFLLQLVSKDVFHQAHLLFTYGYEKNLKDLKTHIPKRCDDVESLKKLYLQNLYILTLPEVGDGKDEIVPKNVQQFWLDLVQKKVLIFTNTIDTSFRLKLYLDQFGIKSAVLNAELPVNSRLHILEKTYLLVR